MNSEFAEASIEIKNLSFRYTAESPLIIDDITLKIYPGQIIGYIGQNGAGKTTTIKILLLTGFEGDVKILKMDISKEKVKYKYKVGYIPENGEMFENLTGREYLDFWGQIYLIEKNKLSSKIEAMSKVFNLFDNLDERISSYSKGMKQKILIICSLIHNPDILFFDEPLNGLDANAVQVFKELIIQLANAGKTIFYSSHIMDVVEKISDRIIILNKGKVIADGSFEELKKESETGSLENIFGKLTGFSEAKEIATEFINCVQESF